jgi:hypothetical protein
MLDRPRRLHTLHMQQREIGQQGRVWVDRGAKEQAIGAAGKGASRKTQESRKEANIPHRNQPKAAAPSFWLLQRRQRPCFHCCDRLHPLVGQIWSGAKKMAAGRCKLLLYHRAAVTYRFPPTRKNIRYPMTGEHPARTYFPGPSSIDPRIWDRDHGKGVKTRE